MIPKVKTDFPWPYSILENIVKMNIIHEKYFVITYYNHILKFGKYKNTLAWRNYLFLFSNIPIQIGNSLKLAETTES